MSEQNSVKKLLYVECCKSEKTGKVYTALKMSYQVGAEAEARIRVVTMDEDIICILSGLSFEQLYSLTAGEIVYCKFN